MHTELIPSSLSFVGFAARAALGFIRLRIPENRKSLIGQPGPKKSKAKQALAQTYPQQELDF